MSWLDWFRKPREAPLCGAPAVRRLKLYTAMSGYVYQYFYEGSRPGAREHQAGTQYVFQVSADRKAYHPVSVFLPRASCVHWEAEHHHPLNSTERYAIAKLALFQAFDCRENPDAVRAHEVVIRADDVAQILDTLDFA